MTAVTIPAAAAGSGAATASVAIPQSRSRRITKWLGSAGGKITVWTIVVLWTIPTFGLLITSFRPETKIKTTGWWTFFNGDWEVTAKNYKDVLKSGSATGGFSDFFLNSVKIAVPGTLLPILFAALAAYAFSWMKFRGRDTLFIVVVGLLVVPLQMALIPLLRLFTTGVHIGHVTLFPAIAGDGSFNFLRDNPVQAWIAHACFAMPLAIFLLKNFISAMPSELIEAARVDGAGHLRIFYKIIVPLCRPGAGLAGDLPVPVGVERLPRRLRVRRQHAAAAGQAGGHRRQPRRGLATAHRRGVRHDDRAAGRVLRVAAVLRPWPRDRRGQGVVAAVRRPTRAWRRAARPGAR